MEFNDAHVKCDQDSIDAVGIRSNNNGFLHLPMPRNDVEKQEYEYIFEWFYDSGYWSWTEYSYLSVWLDISMPETLPRSWVYKDGSLVEWFNWGSGRPFQSNQQDGQEVFVTMTEAGNWIDTIEFTELNQAICTVVLQAGAENVCTWLSDLAVGEPTLYEIYISGKLICKIILYVTYTLRARIY